MPYEILVLETLNARDQAIVLGKRRMLSDKVIAEQLGTHRRGVGKRKQELIARFGAKALRPTPDAKLTSVPDVAPLLGISAAQVRALCQNGEAGEIVRLGREYFLSETNLETLRKHPTVNRTRICGICGNKFEASPNPNGYKRTWCHSTVCEAERNRRETERYLVKKHGRTVSPDMPYNTLKRLIERSKLPEEQEWLTREEALEYAGINFGQLDGLVRRGLITEEDHSELTWRGRPVRIYSKSELNFVSYVFNEYRRRTRETVIP